MVPRRRLRNAVVALAGAIVLPLATRALPDAPPDVEAEMQRFADTEKRAIDTYNRLVRQSQGGRLNDLDFAEAIERQVLPPWVESRQRIEGLLDVPYVDRSRLTRLVAFMRCREESWQMQVVGLREQDPEKLEQAMDRWNTAEEMIEELTAR
jgi:hypothetical protein